MNSKRLNIIREYLKQSGENNRFPFQFLDLQLAEYKTVYGFIENKIAISDNGSFYLLYDYFPKKKRIVKKSIYIPNIDHLYQDILRFSIDKDYLFPTELEYLILSNNQVKFYREFLGEKVENFYDNKNHILVSKSDLGEGFIYTKKR